MGDVSLPMQNGSAAPVDAGRDDTLPVSEAFVSIQGEGKLTGVPSWFLRLAGCNLRCRWCDTPYVPLTHALHARGMHITIETAGTVTLPGVKCHLMSLSPKLANSTPSGGPRDPSGKWAQRHDARRLNFSSLNELVTSTPDRQLKFVVTGPGDLPEIDSVLGRIRGWRPEDVVLMPEGVTVPDPASVAWVVDTCRTRGWRYGDRLHIRLFGDTMGT